LRGEIFADGFASRPERYAGLRRVTLLAPNGEPAGGFTVAEVRPYQGRLLFRFAEVTSIGEAEKLTGCQVCVQRAERAVLPGGEFYIADLTGCDVIDRRSGERLGTVTGWQEYGGPGLLEVERAGAAGPLLVPFARSICVLIDPAARRIEVELPEGLERLDETGGGV
jgi:16S rRNA processing protein RimM